MAMFKAFKPSGMEKIARAMGYQGNMQGFQSFLSQDPMRQQQMQQYQQKAMQMANGGMVQQPVGMPFGIANFAAQPNQQDENTLNMLMQGEAARKEYKQQFEADPRFTAFQDYQKEFDAKVRTDPRITAMEDFQQRLAQQRDQYLQGQPQQSSGFASPTSGLLGLNLDPRLRNQILKQQQEQQQRQMASMPKLADSNFKMPTVTGNKPEGYDEFLNSDFYKNIPEPIAMTQDMYQSKYGLGTFGSGTIGGAIDKAYEQFLASRNQPSQTAQQATTPAAQAEAPQNVTEASIQRMYQPGLPVGGVTQAAMTPSEAGQYIDPRVGSISGTTAVPTAMATTTEATAAQQQQAAQMQASTAAPAVDAAVQATQAAQGTVDPRAQVTAAQQTATSVGNLEAAQGNAILIDNPVQRQIQEGELISGAAADAQTAANFTEQIQAAEATPSDQATVQGQLAQLTANFDAANPPAWAAGAMRNANAQMAARGLGASSLAGQAIIQATMEAALPIAQADAETRAIFERDNLSNRQARAILAAQQRAKFLEQEFDQEFQTRVKNAARIADIADLNFSAEQTVQLENSRLANSMNLENLNNRQALVIAEASALASMDLSNLNNRQQAAVQNASSFLEMDMANLSNEQQTELFKTQQRVQAMFTDQAAENSARQFNATSENQVNQFYDNLFSQTSQFNSAQRNAQAQFNAGQANTVERFNAEINNQRDQFNAQNQLVIAQANAQWRRQIATADTAAVNRANELNANAILVISKTAYANLWQYYSDVMEWAWESAENSLERYNDLAIAQLDSGARKEIADQQAKSAAGTAVGGLIGTVLSAGIQHGFGKIGFGS